jgi:hypothetical protein
MFVVACGCSRKHLKIPINDGVRDRRPLGKLPASSGQLAMNLVIFQANTVAILRAGLKGKAHAGDVIDKVVFAQGFELRLEEPSLLTIEQQHLGSAMEQEVRS